MQSKAFDKSMKIAPGTLFSNLFLQSFESQIRTWIFPICGNIWRKNGAQSLKGL